jgi:hypothetical protein
VSLYICVDSSGGFNETSQSQSENLPGGVEGE